MYAILFKTPTKAWSLYTTHVYGSYAEAEKEAMELASSRVEVQVRKLEMPKSR